MARMLMTNGGEVLQEIRQPSTALGNWGFGISVATASVLIVGAAAIGMRNEVKELKREIKEEARENRHRFWEEENRRGRSEG